MKRVFESFLSAAALVLLAPVFAAATIAIVLESGPPIFFTQTRVGLAGRPFRLWKFRTMRDLPASLAITVSGDPRITRVGKLLRETKLDELPQLINIFLGSMSFVGPRPEIPSLVNRSTKIWREILAVRPGLVDPASLHMAQESRLLAAYADPMQAYNDIILPQKLALSRQYLKQRTMLSDVKLIMQALLSLFRVANPAIVNDQDLIAKLLCRPEDQFPTRRETWHGKRLLVTGGAGFIGSELCRRLAACKPELLLALDHCEDRLGQLVREELQQTLPVLADIRDERRMRDIFAEYRPEIVFHTAAYKHVSLLEKFPFETIENNMLATANLADLSESYGSERFIFISTDKAVEPLSIMGASKRLAEILLSTRKAGPTHFSSLRCGNVLGSSGSVLPIWIDQISHGGPLTITDESAERFFVNVNEAAGALMELVDLPSGLFAYAVHSAVSIGGLARRVLDLLAPDQRIDFEIVGLQTGEKLLETICSTDEVLSPTRSSHIQAVQSSQPAPWTAAKILGELQRVCNERNLDRLQKTIQTAIPCYAPASGLYNGERNYENHVGTRR